MIIGTRTTNYGGKELEIERIIVTPIIERREGHPDMMCWQAKVYVAIYEQPIFESRQFLSPSGAVMSAWMVTTGQT